MSRPRSTRQGEPMISDSIETTVSPAPEAQQPKAESKPTKKAKIARKASRTKEAEAKRKAERSSRKTQVISPMKRAKGATLAEIMKATSWQAHTVRGFISILGKKGAEKIESTKSADGERTYKIK